MFGSLGLIILSEYLVQWQETEIDADTHKHTIFIHTHIH